MAQSHSGVTIELIHTSNRQTVCSTERGVVELLQVSTEVISKVYPTFGCTVTLDVSRSTVTINGGKAINAGRWLKRKVTLVRVDKTTKSPVFITAMRLRDVAREVTLILQQFPASFELTEDELVVYSWSEMDLQSAVSAIHDVVGEREFEVYEFAGNNSSKQAFYSRLDYWNMHYNHCVCVQVDNYDRHRYFAAGFVSHVQLLCEELLPYWRHKIVRDLTPEQAELLLAYGGSLFDSVDDCHMTLSADNSEMVVYCTQRAEAEVMLRCDCILCVIMLLSCTEPPEADTDIIAMSCLLNVIETDNKVVIQCDQSGDRDDSESRSEQMFVGPSHCVDTSDKTQLRLVDADITDLREDAIVSTIDEHGTPNTTLAKRIAATANNGYEKQSTAVKPLDYRKNNVQHQDDGTAVHQLIHERQRSTHDTVDTKSTYDNVSQQHKPSDNRNNRSNSPDQTDESVKITSSELRQSSEYAQINVKITTQS